METPVASSVKLRESRVITSRKLILKGIVWSLLDTFFKFALKFFFALAITRILTPRDYGLVAYIGIFMGIAAWLSEGGFGTALVQKKNADQTDFSTAFFFNFSVSLSFFALYFFTAPVIAGYFNESALVGIIRVASLNLVLNSLCYVHQIKLIKQIDFKEQAIMNFSTSIISGGVGLTLALLDYGYWALVFQTLTGTILRMFGLWYIVRWKPALTFSLYSFREQFRFGSKVFIQGLFESIFREIHSAVIGKNYQTIPLGNYSRGYKFYELFIVETGIAINKVLYPAMVRKTEEYDSNRYKSVYAKTYNGLFFITAPLSLFLLLFSGPIAHVLLTDKWIQAVPYMKLYFIAGFIYMPVYFNSIMLLSTNRPLLYLKLDMLRNIFMAIALFFTYQLGIQAIIIGWLAVYFLFYIIYEYNMRRIQLYEPAKYIKMLQVIAGIIPMYLFYLATAHFITNQVYLLIVNTVVQPLLYLMTMRFSGFKVYRDFCDLLKPVIPERMRFLV
jgi:O-antigen/teichoic acid export membrane protein